MGRRTNISKITAKNYLLIIAGLGIGVAIGVVIVVFLDNPGTAMRAQVELVTLYNKVAVGDTTAEVEKKIDSVDKTYLTVSRDTSTWGIFTPGRISGDN